MNPEGEADLDDLGVSWEDMYGAGPPDRAEGGSEWEKAEGQAVGCEGGEAGGLESRRRVARSLSSRCQRDRHQTHSPWGRCRVGSGPGLPESQRVKVGENMPCLGNEFWNETYISKGSEGRAGQAGALRRKAPRRGIEEPGSPSSGRAWG